MTSEKWRIRVAGYGTFDFVGTEQEAEEMRIHKGQYERGSSIKWRADQSTALDRITAEIAEYADSGKGIPMDKFLLRAALLKGPTNANQ